MKKILTYLMALSLVAFVAAVFPRVFLIGNAKWTYQNNMAEIDISFSKNSSNTSIKVMGGGK